MANESTNGAVPEAVSPNEDATIDKVKELLFGQEKRQADEKIAGVRSDLQALETRIDKKLEQLSKEIGRLEKAHSDDLEARLGDIGEAITMLGKTISSSAKPK